MLDDDPVQHDSGGEDNLPSKPRVRRAEKGEPSEGKAAAAAVKAEAAKTEDEAAAASKPKVMSQAERMRFQLRRR